MQLLVSRAGLTLNAGQMADLVLAWRQLAALIEAIPRDRPLSDDQAFVFRLPPPKPKTGPISEPAQAKPSPRTSRKPTPSGARKRVRAGR